MAPKKLSVQARRLFRASDAVVSTERCSVNQPTQKYRRAVEVPLFQVYKDVKQEFARKVGDVSRGISV
jgi:hypothetical protein